MHRLNVSLTPTVFYELVHTVEFDRFPRVSGQHGNRMEAVLVRSTSGSNIDHVPLVRSTTTRWTPACEFTLFHELLAERVGQKVTEYLSSAIPLFNNALMEIHDKDSRKIGYHSDMGLDLFSEPNENCAGSDSWVAMVSIYSEPSTANRRVLHVKNKRTGYDTRYVLDHGSVVFFPAKANSEYSHAIEMEKTPNSSGEYENDGCWMRITFRTSRTFLTFPPDGPPRLLSSSGETALRLATKAEKDEMFRLRQHENDTAGMVWPRDISYTTSPGDLKKPTTAEKRKAQRVRSLKKISTLRMDSHVLVLFNERRYFDSKFLEDNFAGETVVRGKYAACEFSPTKLGYLAGDIGGMIIMESDVDYVRVIKELSYNYDESLFKTVTLGQVPISVEGVGIMFRGLFDDGKNRFQQIENEHRFQHLTESTKPGTALRTGLYITDVQKKDDSFNFKLLRCSTNLAGPTEGLRETDREILSRANEIASQHIHPTVEFNHVLAQIYHNRSDRQKAKISDHSDKTKDMPENAAMAFCTFYEPKENWHKDIEPSKQDPFDWCYRGCHSALTTLVFTLKGGSGMKNMTGKFTVTLYPDSVFLIPIETNRYYRHRIQPSALSKEFLPTRMGYVVRCSKTDAVFRAKDHPEREERFRHGDTFVIGPDGGEHLLTVPTPEEKQQITDMYRQENVSVEKMSYGFITCSLNDGDRTMPVPSA